MKVSFTICSANYLPYAKSLGDSLIKYNSDHLFIIILLDKGSQDYNSFAAPHTIINVEDMKLEFFEEMNERYDIFELSCALKSFVADYIFQTFSHCELLFYFDADILVFNSLENAEMLLSDHSILITPHLATLNDFDNRIEIEKMVFRAGIFNAGFFGLRRCDETHSFLKWWMLNMRIHCYKDISTSLFDDQIWLNFVPVYFKNAIISNNLGCNAAYWNMGERKIIFKSGQYFINENIPLVFFHFSGHDFNNELLLSKYYPKYTFENLPECKSLFQDYKNRIIKNRLECFSEIKPFYGTQTPFSKTSQPKVREKNLFKRKYQKWFKTNKT